MSLPSFDHCKRVEYLINHDERLKKFANDYINANAALGDYLDEVYGKGLGKQIFHWCHFQIFLLSTEGRELLDES